MSRRAGAHLKLACAALSAAILFSACEAPTDPEARLDAPQDTIRLGPRKAEVTEAPISNAPAYAVYLDFLEPGVEFGACTGVVLTRHWLMTAGHCVRDAVARFGTYSPNRLTIRSGSFGPSGTAVYTNGAASFYIHPDYSGDDGDLGDDFALIRLYGSGMSSFTRAYIMGETSVGYLLPQSLGNPMIAGYGRGTSPGGGKTCPSTAGGWKRSAEFRAVPNRSSGLGGAMIYWSPGSPFIRELVLTDRDSNGCPGDSGGPIYFRYDGSDKVAGLFAGTKNAPILYDSHRGPSIRRRLQWMIDMSEKKGLRLVCLPGYSDYGPDYWSCWS
jgi:hypothetical protein